MSIGEINTEIERLSTLDVRRQVLAETRERMADAIRQAPDSLEIVEAVEKVPGGFTRPTQISVRSRSTGQKATVTIRYMHPPTHRAWGAEAGRSEPMIEELT